MTSDRIVASASGTIATVRNAIDDTFDRLDSLCSRPVDYLHYRPAYPEAWTVSEHLEHVSLVNHFLLLTIGKGVKIALRRTQTQPIPSDESDLLRLGSIADPGAFPWEPPGHMIPIGAKPVDEVRVLLRAQHSECQRILERMGAGEGRLCSFRMSVYSLGMLDMYQWLFFLAQHGRWHLKFLAQRESRR